MSARSVPPYKVVATGPGEADVVDRETSEPVGFVIHVWNGPWEAHDNSRLVWPRFYLSSHRTRADAARAVWEASRG